MSVYITAVDGKILQEQLPFSGASRGPLSSDKPTRCPITVHFHVKLPNTALLSFSVHSLYSIFCTKSPSPGKLPFPGFPWRTSLRKPRSDPTGGLNIIGIIWYFWLCSLMINTRWTHLCRWYLAGYSTTTTTTRKAFNLFNIETVHGLRQQKIKIEVKFKNKTKVHVTLVRA